jgi:hypothetical protein
MRPPSGQFNLVKSSIHLALFNNAYGSREDFPEPTHFLLPVGARATPFNTVLFR